MCRHRGPGGRRGLGPTGQGERTLSSGCSGSSEPLANRGVRAGLRDAFYESGPGPGTDPNRHEQDGFIIRRSNPVVRFLFGEYRIERWDPGGVDWINEPDAPAGADVVGSFHTHPNYGADIDGSAWRPSASPQAWFDWGDSTTPHYIISNSAVFRVGNGVQSSVGSCADVFGR